TQTTRCRFHPVFAFVGLSGHRPAPRHWNVPSMTAMLWIPLALVGAGMVLCLHLAWKRNIVAWLSGYLRQDWRAPVPPGATKHVLFCFVDHYEPMWDSPDYDT